MIVYVWILSCVWLFATPWTIARQGPLSIEFSRQEHWSRLPFPSPRIFLTQRSNLGLLHYRQILYCLGHQGSSIKGTLWLHEPEIKPRPPVWQARNPPLNLPWTRITTNWKILKEMGIPDHIICLLRNRSVSWLQRVRHYLLAEQQ